MKSVVAFSYGFGTILYAEFLDKKVSKKIR